MSTLYEVSSLVAFVMNKPNNFAQIIGTLSRSTQIDVISISGNWAYFKFNNSDAYVKKNNLKIINNPSIEVKGSINLKYLDVSTNNEVYSSETISNLSLGTYTYEAKTIYGYKLTNISPQSVTLTITNPNQTIIFYYNKILGSITIKYINENTNEEIYSPTIINNLELGSYSYGFIDISGYKLQSNSTQTVSLTADNPNKEILFKYSEILGSVTIKYIDNNTNFEIASAESYTNLKLGDYTYEAKAIPSYTVIGNSSETITLSEVNPIVTIIFRYEEILGTITVSYVDENNNKISDDKVDTKLKLGSYTYTAIDISDYKLISDSSVTVTLTDSNYDISIVFKYKSIILYVIELNKFNIFNDNTNAQSTTKGINNALIYAKQQGFKKVKLLPGTYAIDTSITNDIVLTDGTSSWTHHRKGISMQSNMELILTDTILEMLPTDDPYYSILTISGCTNSKITDGYIIGDKYSHDYGSRINDTGIELESGSIDDSTGIAINDSSTVRTINYITKLTNWFTKESYSLPKNFNIIPVYNTTFNTSDGGKVKIFCYDNNNKYLGRCSSIEYGPKILLDGTSKIKITILNEKRLDCVLAINQQSIYYNPEFPAGILLTGSKNIEINGSKVINCCGDCIQTFAPPIKITVDNLNIINCILEGSRRQGISFTATGENYLIKGCNIGKIQGTDPQAGIDFEHYDYIKNVIIDSCSFYDTKKLDIINYNANDIEIKNCNFTGGIGVTFGWNMNIHDNRFIYSDPSWLDKSHKGWAISPNSLDKGNSYFNIINNSFEGYNIGGIGVQSSQIPNSNFTQNKITNSNCRLFGNVYNNTYENSTIRYVTIKEFKNETLINCLLASENNGNNTLYRYYTEFTLINCSISGGSLTLAGTIFSNCVIYNDNKVFCNTWSGSYSVENSKIITKYSKYMPFIQEQGCPIVTFKNCIMDLSCTPFVQANYKVFNLQSCTITFNNSYNSTSTISVFNTGNFDNNKFYKNFDYPKVKLPSSTNSTINDVPFTNSIIV